MSYSDMTRRVLSRKESDINMPENYEVTISNNNFGSIYNKWTKFIRIPFLFPQKRTAGT